MTFKVVLLVAIALRVWGLSYGLPHVYHQDEPIVVNHAMAVGAEGWNTRTYLPPQFASYFLFFFYGAAFVIAKLFGFVQDTNAFALGFLSDPTAFYLIGRVVLGVVPGVAGVWALKKLGDRFFSKAAGTLAALFLAVSPLHSQHSHYIYMDVALSLAVTLLFYCLFEWMEAPSRARVCKIGALFGLCVAVKYTAVYFFPILALAVLFSNARGKLTALAAIGALSILTYAAISPFTFLDWANFISQVAGQARVRGYQGPWHHLNYSLAGGTGVLFLILAAAGALFALGARGANARILMAAAGFYYAVNAVYSQPFPRYMMPLVPFLCLFAAEGTLRLRGSWGNRRAFKTFLLLALCEMLLPSLYSDHLMTQKDTRTQALEWVQAHVPPGSTVVVDHRFFGPPLLQTSDQIEEKFAFLGPGEERSARKKRLDLALEAVRGRPAYRVFTMTTVPDVADTFLFHRPTVKADVNSVAETGADYVIFNHAEIDAAKHSLKERLPGLELAARFSPYRSASKRVSGDRYDATAAPHSRRDLFSRERLGPYLELYRVRR